MIQPRLKHEVYAREESVDIYELFCICIINNLSVQENVSSIMRFLKGNLYDPKPLIICSYGNIIEFEGMQQVI